MALGYDMTDLINSTNAAAEAIYGYVDRQEENKRYQEEQKRLNEQAALEEEWRKKNYELQASAFNYQKELNQKQMEREDTQFSRSMADYRRAGLSGLAAIGTSAGAGSLTSLPAPQMDTSGSRDVLNSRINSSRNRTQSRLERFKAVMSSYLQFKQLNLERTNQVLQGIQLGNDISKANLEKKKLAAETSEIEFREQWERKNGFRNLDWQSKLIAVLDNYLSSGKPQQIVDKISNEKKDIVQALNEIKVEFNERMAHDINQILNKGDYSNQPNNLPDRYVFSPMTYSRIDKLTRAWSPDLARKTYYNSSILRSCFTEDAWMNYYSKNTSFLKGIFKENYQK